MATAQEKVYTFHTYTPVNGLTSESIQCIAQDQAGYIWLATTDGLVRYDGYHFSTFRYNPSDSSSLSCNNITYILPLENNKLLIGTYDCGINIFDTQLEKAERIVNDTNAHGKTGDNRVLSFFRDRQQRIWVGLNDGSLNLFDLRHKRVIPIKLPSPDGQLPFAFCHGFSEHLSDTNLMWIGTTTGLVLFHKQQFSFTLFKYTDEYPAANPIFNRSRYPVQTDPQNVWMASWGGGVTHYHIPDGHWEHFLLDSTPPLSGGKNIVMGIAPKSKTTLWIITSDKGLGIFDLPGKSMSFPAVRTKTGESLDHSGQYLFSGARKQLWVGYAKGLAFHQESHRPFEQYQVPPTTKTNLKQFNHPGYFLEDRVRKGLWVASFHADGLSFYSYQTSKWTLYPLPERLLPRGIIWNGRGNILLLTASELLEFDTEKKQYRPVKMPDNLRVQKNGGYAMMLARSGKLYIGTASSGVFEWDPATGKTQRYFLQEDSQNGLLNKSPVYTLHEDIKGNIWIGQEQGAAVLDVSDHSLRRFSYKQKPAYRAFKDVTAFASGIDGKVWMTSISSGILCIDPLADYAVVKGFGSDEGLLSNVLIGLDKGPDSLLCVYTAKGIQFFNSVTLKSHYLNAPYQFPFPVSEWGSIQYLSGSLYAGFLNGFVRIPSSALSFPEPPAKPVILALNIFDKPYPYKGTEKLELTHLQNFIRIAFTGFDFGNTENIRLNYVVNGLSADTFHTDKGLNELTLTGLAPGAYELTAWFSYPESGIHSETNRWLITICPPWWQTWWFYLVVFLVFMAVTYLVYRYRLNNDRVKNNLRRQLAEMENTALRAQMNPHFLFNSLNSVNYYIQNNEPEKASLYLKRFSKLVRLILNHTRKDSVSLEDELEALRIYLELEALRFSDHFSYHIEVAEHILVSEIIIPPLLLQPYVENAIWHGIMQSEHGGSIRIAVNENEGVFTFTIEDNGIGREKARELKSKSALEQKSHGIDITRQRVHLFNTTHAQQIAVEITDVIHKDGSVGGTRVTITYKT